MCSCQRGVSAQQGLDMVSHDQGRLELAERNRAEAGVENVTFLKGIIEAIPLPTERVDVVISNCVINLSADKGQVLREAYRVLTPGGRFAVSDIVFQGQLPQALRADLKSWAGCIAGASLGDLSPTAPAWPVSRISRWKSHAAIRCKTLLKMVQVLLLQPFQKLNARKLRENL